MNLLPTNVKIYDAYWASINRYNDWFIKLRYWAVLSLVLLYLTLEFVIKVNLSSAQTIMYFAITLLILVYNYVFDRILKNSTVKIKKEYQLRLELYQTVFDLFSLSILTYFLGGIEAPIFLFFIFHMIIGSLILPTMIMYLIAGVLIGSFSVFSFMEYFGVIKHQSISGLYQNSFYNDIHFVAGYLFIFAFVLLFCIYLSSKIVYELYSRENHLKNALDQLHAAEESKQKYIMAVVHELKSPIAAASSHLDLVLGGYTGDVSESVRDKIQKAKFRTEDSIATINNILRVSKFRLLSKVEREDLDIVKILMGIIDDILPVADRKDITLQLVKDANEIMVNGDGVLLKLAISNLISNSVKYTLKGGKVEIRIIEKDNLILLSIADNGIGIPAKDHDKIFQEFYRASNAEENKIEGTGTGLNIVKQIVEAHSGSINFNSPSGIGTKERPGTVFEMYFQK